MFLPTSKQETRKRSSYTSHDIPHDNSQEWEEREDQIAIVEMLRQCEIWLRLTLLVDSDSVKVWSLKPRTRAEVLAQLMGHLWGDRNLARHQCIRGASTHGRKPSGRAKYRRSEAFGRQRRHIGYVCTVKETDIACANSEQTSHHQQCLR